MAAYPKRMKNGEVVMCYRNRFGQERQLLNPAQKGRRYAKELKTGRNMYNGYYLRPNQKSFRSGYLKARTDSANAFKSKNPNYCRNCGYNPVSSTRVSVPVEIVDPVTLLPIPNQRGGYKR